MKFRGNQGRVADAVEVEGFVADWRGAGLDPQYFEVGEGHTGEDLRFVEQADDGAVAGGEFGRVAPALVESAAPIGPRILKQPESLDHLFPNLMPAGGG